MRAFRSLLTVVTLALAPVAASAQDYEQWLAAGNALRWVSDQEWKFNLAAGVGLGPTYQYSRDYEMKPLVLIDVEWRERVFLSTQRGIGYNVISNAGTQAGVRLTVDWGRSPDDEPFLEGTDEVKRSTEAGLFWINYSGPWRANADIKYALQSHKGLRGAVGLAHGGQIARDTSFILGAEAHWASPKYNEAYYGQEDFGVNDITPYITFVRNFRDGFYLTVDGRVSFVFGPAHDTDITADRSYFTGAMVGKRF